MGTLMELQDVWKIYRMGEFDVPALQGINLSVEESEFVAITGPSGCGKSTMLNMIGCLDMPTRGKVLLEGRDISEFKSNELALLVDRINPQGRGAAMGTFTASFDLGIGMGSIVMGLILQYAGISQALIGLFGRIAGFTTIYILGALIVLAALVLFITGYKNKGGT